MSGTLVNEVSDAWEAKGLLREGRIVPTFIEEVGTASAENTRSAAFMRWASRNPDEFFVWLSETTETARISEGAIEREFKLPGVKRKVDLVVTASGVPKAFFEFKWDSQVDFKQIRGYREIINKEFSESVPLLVVSPFKLRETVSDILPSKVTFLVSWSELFETLLRGSNLDGNDIENDFTRSVYRWWSLQNLVRVKLTYPVVHLDEFSNLMLWMRKVALEVKLRDYIGLTGKLIANEIAEAMLAAPELDGWRKCGLGKGANGSDASCDICSKNINLCQFQIRPDERIAVVVRVRVDLTRGRISLQIGSEMEPYLGRKQKKEVKQADTMKWKRLHKYSSEVRNKLIEEIVRNDLSKGKVGNPNTEDSWSRNFHFEYADFASVNADLPKVFSVVRNTMIYMNRGS